MVFSSLTFICIFLPAVFLLTLAVPGIRRKNFLLAVFSLVFYAYGEPVYVLLMLISTIANWLFGLLIGQGGSDGQSPGRRKIYLAAAVVLNLGFLGFFKYAGFLVSTVNGLTGLSIAQPQVALPVGISFYTFQAMSYVIDVYRGEAQGQRSWLKVLLYISFFPQLIAGPIVRYRDIAAQMDSRQMTLRGVSQGFRRFCFGLAKKVLISNTMGITADAVFGASQANVNICGAWIGAIAYVVQIYFDFSGYSDMAIGLAQMFGFTYRENFQYPYTSTTMREFWRRWHISLSSWLKEYLYIPLGGNRKGRLRTVLNKLIVFFCCGLWHGAAWTFVVWGLIHGCFLLLEEYLPVHKLPKALGWIYTMLVVTFAFVVFRADDMGQALFMMRQMITGVHFEETAMALFLEQLTPLFLLTLVCAVIASAPVKGIFEKRIAAAGEDGTRFVIRDALGYLLALALLVLSFLSLASGGYNPFIYFRF